MKILSDVAEHNIFVSIEANELEQLIRNYIAAELPNLSGYEIKLRYDEITAGSPPYGTGRMKVLGNLTKKLDKEVTNNGR